MANTITIQSDVTDSQLISNLRAVSTADRSIFVEVPNQNPAKSTNGGQHPWSLSATMTTKLYLYNATADTVTPTIRVYSGSQLWVQPTKLAPFETKVLDIRSLFDNAVKDSKGHVLTGASNGNLQGIVSWNSLKTNSIHGRVLQIDRTTLLTRNFSCELVYIACGAGFDPSSLFTVISASGDVLGGATTCPSIGQCTCDGSSCPGGVLEEASGYGWFVYSPEIAPITAGTYSSTATFFGNSVGSTTFDLTVYDDSGCYADGQGPVSVNPTIVTNPGTLWFWGNGFTVSGYPSQGTIEAVGASGGSFSWTITSGTGKVSFNSNPGSPQSSITTSANTVTIYAISYSLSANDVTVSLTWTPTAGSPYSATATVTVDSPYKVVPSGGNPVIAEDQTCGSGQGYLEEYQYTVYGCVKWFV